MKLLMMKNNKVLLRYLLCFIFLNTTFLFSSDNFYIKQNQISTNSEDKIIEIYFDLENSKFQTNIFPLYIKFSYVVESSSEIYPMEYAYWECSTCFKKEYNISNITSNELLVSFSDNPYFETDVLEEVVVDLYSLNKYQKNDYELLYSESLNLIENKIYDKGIAKLNFIIENSSNYNLVADSKYLISEIYLNDFNNYDLAILYLEDIINNFSESKISKKALFSLSYIYANYLDYYSDAIELYNRFMILYPNDELITSVKYELEILNTYKKTIDELIQTSK